MLDNALLSSRLSRQLNNIEKQIKDNKNREGRIRGMLYEANHHQELDQLATQLHIVLDDLKQLTLAHRVLMATIDDKAWSITKEQE